MSERVFNSSLITHHSSLSCRGHVGLADVEVGGDLLHVVVVFERLHQFEHLLGLRAFETLELLRDHLDLRDLRLDAGVLDRGEYRVEVVGRGDYLEVVHVVAQVFRARVRDYLEQFLFGLRGLRHDDVALALEYPVDRARRAEVAAVLGEDVWYLRDRPVAVVRHRVNHDGDAARPVALVSYLLVRDAFFGPRAAAHGAVNRVVGHVRALGVGDGFAKARVPFGVAAARPGRDLNLFNQLREELAALGVQSALLVFDGVPLRVSGHTRLCSLGKNFGLARSRAGIYHAVFPRRNRETFRAEFQVPSCKFQVDGRPAVFNLELGTCNLELYLLRGREARERVAVERFGLPGRL